MDWHTDSGMPGWRLYAYAYDPFLLGGVFRYGAERVVESLSGLYLFETGIGCWHAVESFGHRYSIGIQLPAELAKQLVGDA